jgi:hypothetical protein
MVDQDEGSVPVNWLLLSSLNDRAAQELYQPWRLHNSQQQSGVGLSLNQTCVGSGLACAAVWQCGG